MQPKLFQTAVALYKVEEWDGQNLSGLLAISNMILIRADECAPFTAGGSALTDEVREQNSLASETGVIVDIGSQAFKYTLAGRPWPDDDERKPKVGDRIWFPRYSGRELNGYDRRLYRMLNDSNVGGIFDLTHAPFIEWPKHLTTEGGWQFPTVLESGEGESTPIAGADQKENADG